jgi:hypothetical protein
MTRARLGKSKNKDANGGHRGLPSLPMRGPKQPHARPSEMALYEGKLEAAAEAEKAPSLNWGRGGLQFPVWVASIVNLGKTVTIGDVKPPPELEIRTGRRRGIKAERLLTLTPNDDLKADNLLRSILKRTSQYRASLSSD